MALSARLRAGQNVSGLIEALGPWRAVPRGFLRSVTGGLKSRGVGGVQGRFLRQRDGGGAEFGVEGRANRPESLAGVDGCHRGDVEVGRLVQHPKTAFGGWLALLDSQCVDSVLQLS